MGYQNRPMSGICRAPSLYIGWGVVQLSCTEPGVRCVMLKWALIFFVIALIAAALGFTGVAGAAAGIAKFLFFLFVGIFVIMLILGLIAGRKMF